MIMGGRVKVGAKHFNLTQWLQVCPQKHVRKLSATDGMDLMVTPGFGGLIQGQTYNPFNRAGKMDEWVDAFARYQSVFWSRRGMFNVLAM